MKYSYAAVSDVGKREINEDALKDKIDTSNLTNEKVLKYVADIKEPTVAETEASK